MIQLHVNHHYVNWRELFNHISTKLSQTEQKQDKHEVLRADTSWGGIFGNFVTPRSVPWQEKDTVT